MVWPLKEGSYYYGREGDQGFRRQRVWQLVGSRDPEKWDEIVSSTSLISPGPISSMTDKLTCPIIQVTEIQSPAKPDMKLLTDA
jgi:hypothetical protein